MIRAWWSGVRRPRVLAASLVFAAAALAATVLHYAGAIPGGPSLWLPWIVAMALHAWAHAGPPPRRPAPAAAREVLLGASLLAGYLASHLWAGAAAPWNDFGLFDDAAWDLHFARLHVLAGPYQAAFHDPVGAISRETTFHYYVTAFFEVLGYNLATFNLSLLALGAVTVVGTGLIVRRLTGSVAIAVLAAVILNFLPLHYTQVFVGHRYAIAAPLMVLSLFLLYEGAGAGGRGQRPALVVLSAIAAALCLDSAIMGKQVILALVLAGVALPILDRACWRMPETRAALLTWGLAFLIAATPLLVYIAFNRVDYFRHEGGLLGDFVGRWSAGGVTGVAPYVDQLREVFLAGGSFLRLWSHDWPLIPFTYYPLLLGGLVVLVLRGRTEAVLLAVIPVASAFLAGPYDFRVLLAAPAWVVAMGVALGWLRRDLHGRVRARRWLPFQAAAILLVAAGLLPSAAYLWGLSHNPNAEYLLSHRDVAVARLIQDVVAGSEAPSASMKPDELDRTPGPGVAGFDALACPTTAYAVAHLYLQAFDDRRVLALCDGGTQALVGRDRLLGVAVAAIRAYQPAGRGLKLIWEESAISKDTIAWFGGLARYGASGRLAGAIDGSAFAVWVLAIPAEQVGPFREAVLARAPVAP